MNLARIIPVMALFAILLLPGCIGQAQDGGEQAGGLIKTNFSVVVYHGIGCPHCSNVINLLNDLEKTYDFSMEIREIRYDPQNMKAFEAEYARFGADISNGGIPTLIINGNVMVVGELGRGALTRAIEIGDSGRCPAGAYTGRQFTDMINSINETQEMCEASEMNLADNVNKTETMNGGGIPLMVLIPAAVADSINPCTMAVMAMLLAITLQKEGKKKVLMSGIIFSSVIFICYILMGMGIMKAMGDIGVQKYFFYVMMAITALITALEIKSFFFYEPGMGAIEMPMFLRPKLHMVMNMATSLPMVALVAVFCSLFLLPCSSGPYLMVLSMLSLTSIWTAEFFKAMAYLVIYNIIFVLPLFAITLIVAFGIKDPAEILSLKDKYVREMHLVTGIIMLALTIMLAAFVFQGSWFN